MPALINICLIFSKLFSAGLKSSSLNLNGITSRIRVAGMIAPIHFSPNIMGINESTIEANPQKMGKEIAKHSFCDLST